MPTRLQRLLAVLQRVASRRFYPGVVAAIATADYFVPGAPTNALLAASVLPRPDRWRILGIAFAIGCAVGAFLLATLLGVFGEPLVVWVRGSEGAALWHRIETFVNAYGLFALAALAVSPFPVRIAVSVLALTGSAPLLLGGIVLAGRLVIYPIVAWLAARAPHRLMRFRPFARVLRPIAPHDAPRPSAPHHSLDQ